MVLGDTAALKMHLQPEERGGWHVDLAFLAPSSNRMGFHWLSLLSLIHGRGVGAMIAIPSIGMGIDGNKVLSWQLCVVGSGT